jgi:hypothetical protein
VCVKITNFWSVLTLLKSRLELAAAEEEIAGVEADGAKRV